jgi:hypothetical protein
MPVPRRVSSLLQPASPGRRYAVVTAAAVTLLSACAATPQRTAAPAERLSVAPAAATAPAAKAAPTGPAAAAPGPAAAAVTDPSWNMHVTCRATVTTLRAVLGSQRSSLGGATFAGGGFKPGIPDKRSTNPPCSVSGVPTLVELRRVQFSSCSKINNDGDWTCPLIDPSQVGKLPKDLNGIHVELDGEFRAKGWAPKIPPGGKLVDIQGFVFWDPGHTTAAWHFHSGWEIHSFTAWRLSS